MQRKPPTEYVRRLPAGAEVLSSGGVHFRVWAPKRRRVEVVVGSEPFALNAEGDGYHSGYVASASDGADYGFRLDGDDRLYPDPVSRFQPQGPRGPSRILDPARFRWTDHQWQGARLRGQVLYEMHIGTFTASGTWQAAARELPALADLGISMIEMMPVADFTGRFGWGYDGVNLFAPTHLYGEPDDLRRFVDDAHRVGIAVILDVVYNHLGPEENHLTEFSDDYFTSKYDNEWGAAINFDGPGAQPVREFFAANAGYWIDEYHFDGLRLDATQQIFDASDEHILKVIGERVRQAAGARATVLIAENEPQATRLVRSVAEGGFGLDALWNDDFHHTARVALTGRREAYYSDYLGTPQEFISALKYGYLYQGQVYTWQENRRGTPSFGLPPEAFVLFLENHDQIANSARGDRLHRLAAPGRYRAMTALMLLAPATPMFFQGQEFAASNPFCFFADHQPELADKVRAGRTEFLTQFPSLAEERMRDEMPDPESLATFERCKLDFEERTRHATAYALHRDLLKLRRTDAVFNAQRERGMDGAVLGPECLVLRFFGEQGDDRLLLVNLGTDFAGGPAPEPLLGPPPAMQWQVLWSSDDPAYGGSGAIPAENALGWRIPGQAAVVMQPFKRQDQHAGQKKNERRVKAV
ncbi:MAG: malto-oligosyltrehalose trehalohydrolase [Pirellulaceae bacterium]